MARRIRWIGNSRKYIDGDCIIVNFRDPWLVNWLLRPTCTRYPYISHIISFPLGYFYKLGPGSLPALNAKRLTVPHEIHPASTLPQYAPISVTSRFEALGNLSSLDGLTNNILSRPNLISKFSSHWSGPGRHTSRGLKILN